MVDIIAAAPNVVEWKRGNSLPIATTRRQIEVSLAFAETYGYRDLEGIRVYRDELRDLHAAMDEAALTADERETDRIQDWITGGL